MKSIWVIAAVLLSVAVIIGCSRYIESEDPVRSLPGEVPVPVNLVAQISNAGTVTLSWEVSDSASVARFRIYISDSTQSSYTLRDSTGSFSMTVDGLLANQRYFFKVAAVMNEGLQGDLSEAVSAKAMFLSITIANDKEYTNSRNVLIQINAPPETSHLMLSEDSTFADAVYVQFIGTQTSFTLSEGDGDKTVYARLLFGDGSQSGEPLFDDITLDTHARIDSVFFTPTGITFSPGDTVTFGLDAGESGGTARVSFTGVGEVKLFDDGTNGDLTADDGIYHGDWIVPVTFTLYNGGVTGSLTDDAGNVAAQIMAAEPLNIFGPPLPVTLSAIALSTFEIDLSWTPSVSSNFSAYRLYRSISPSVPDDTGLVTSISAVNTTSFTDTMLNHSTTYYYRMYVYDNSGLNSGSNVDSSTTFVNTEPDSVELFVIAEPDTTARLTWTVSKEDDFEHYRVFVKGTTGVDSSDELIALISNRSTDNYSYKAPDTGQFFFRVFVYDKHGLSAGSNEDSVTLKQ